MNPYFHRCPRRLLTCMMSPPVLYDVALFLYLRRLLRLAADTHALYTPRTHIRGRPVPHPAWINGWTIAVVETHVRFPLFTTYTYQNLEILAGLGFRTDTRRGTSEGRGPKNAPEVRDLLDEMGLHTAPAKKSGKPRVVYVVLFEISACGRTRQQPARNFTYCTHRPWVWGTEQ